MALAALVVVGSARAEPGRTADAESRAMAEALFRDAKELQAAGKLGEACSKFAESHRLDPKPGTILNLATCHEEEGKTASAWADYMEAIAFAQRAKQPSREKFAKGRAAELEKRLSYVVVKIAEELAADATLEVRVDDKVLTSATVGTRMPLDPGEHTFEARAAGKTPWTRRVPIAEGPSEISVEVPPLAAEAGPVEPAPAAPRRLEPATPPAPQPGGGTQRTLGWVAIGVGVAATAAGAFFGLRTISEKDTVDAHCTGELCDDEGLAANDRASDAATLSTVGFGIGVGAAIVGVVLLVTAPSSSTPSRALGPWERGGRERRVVVAPSGGPFGASLSAVW